MHEYWPDETAPAVIVNYTLVIIEELQLSTTGGGIKKSQVAASRAGHLRYFRLKVLFSMQKKSQEPSSENYLLLTKDC